MSHLTGGTADVAIHIAGGIIIGVFDAGALGFTAVAGSVALVAILVPQRLASGGTTAHTGFGLGTGGGGVIVIIRALAITTVAIGIALVVINVS